MHVVTLRKRQRFEGEARQALAHGVEPALDMRGFSAVFPNQVVATTVENVAVGVPVVTKGSTMDILVVSLPQWGQECVIIVRVMERFFKLTWRLVLENLFYFISQFVTTTRNLTGRDKHGDLWYTRLLDEDRQVWVQVRGDEICNGGLNQPSRYGLPLMGLTSAEHPQEDDSDDT